MAKRYGVFCGNCYCCAFIEQGEVSAPYRNEITFYTAPSDPVRCENCGRSYLYGQLVTENGEPLI